MYSYLEIYGNIKEHRSESFILYL